MDPDLAVPLSGRLSPRAWVALDGALATLLLSVSIAGIAIHHEAGQPTGPIWDAFRYLAAALACAPLPLRRRWPIAVLIAIAIGDASLVALGVRGPGQTAVAFAIFTVAATSPRRLPLRTAGIVASAMLFAALITSGGPEWTAIIAGPSVVLVGWFAGENTRARRAYGLAVAERMAERERRREEHIRQAVTDERLRIARELHDIVAHAMSLIAVRAGAARMVIEDQPDEAREALSIIETTSRRALREMRRLVGVLRQPEDTTDAELEPAPGLTELEELVRHATQAGVRVDVQVTGAIRSLPSGVDVSAYRIIQEALTNVVRHAGPTHASLRVSYGLNELEIELLDDGATTRDRSVSSRSGNSSGHGLVGMRERVALYDGELLTEPTLHGYRVRARLPIEDERV